MSDHGTPGGYWRHLTQHTEPCQPCRDAGTAAKARWRRRSYLNHGPLLIDPTGTRRRLHALAAIGWSLSEIGRMAGVSYHTVWSWTDSSRVRADTAETVKGLYDKLSMTTGPSQRARIIAQRKGWPPPLAWADDELDDPAARPHGSPRGNAFDEVAVARAMHGDPVHLRPVERAEAVRRMTANGYSAAEIAARLRVDKRSVSRLRNQRGEVA